MNDKLVEKAGVYLLGLVDTILTVPSGAYTLVYMEKRAKELKQIFLSDPTIVEIDPDAELPETIPELCVVNLVEGRGYPRCMAGWVKKK